MCPLAAHLDAGPSCSPCHSLLGDEPEAAGGETSAEGQHGRSWVCKAGALKRGRHLWMKTWRKLSTMQPAPIDTQHAVPVAISSCWVKPPPPTPAVGVLFLWVLSLFPCSLTLICSIASARFQGPKCNPAPSFASPLPSCCPGNARCFDIITQPTGILSAPLTLP